MHVGYILGVILGVMRVKNQLKTKNFTGPFLRNDNSLFLRCKITPFLHDFLQVLDCGDPLGPENRNGAKLATYPKIEGKWGK